jgi:hypothetical protein
MARYVTVYFRYVLLYRSFFSVSHKLAFEHPIGCFVDKICRSRELNLVPCYVTHRHSDCVACNMQLTTELYPPGSFTTTTTTTTHNYTLQVR